MGGNTLWCISKALWKVILYGHVKALLLRAALLGFFSHGICRSQKRVVAVTLNSKFEFFGWLFLCRSHMLQSGENAGVPNDDLADKWTIWVLSSHWP